MNFMLSPLPSPDVVELLDLPIEMMGTWPPVSHKAEQVRASIELARERQEALEVVHLDDPRTTTFALFL